MENITYFAKPKENIENKREDGRKAWDSQIIEIFSKEGTDDPKRIGEYTRNYHVFYDTFYPFKHANGKWYALYSPHYSCTRIMELPSCKDISVKHDENGDNFCPTGYYIPNYVDYNHEDHDPIRCSQVNIEDDCKKEIKYWDFGFVCGCVWGDDCDWKVQYIDLKEAEKGIVKISERFGYIWLPKGISLKDAINMVDYGTDNDTIINIATSVRFWGENSYENFSMTDIIDLVNVKSSYKNNCNVCKVEEGEMHKDDCTNKQGDMPFIKYPKSVCRRCGLLNPRMHVADDIWKKYIPHKQEEFQLCLKCFKHIKGLIDKVPQKWNDLCHFCGNDKIIDDYQRETHKYTYNCEKCGSGWW